MPFYVTISERVSVHVHQEVMLMRKMCVSHAMKRAKHVQDQLRRIVFLALLVTLE